MKIHIPKALLLDVAIVAFSFFLGFITHNKILQFYYQIRSNTGKEVILAGKKMDDVFRGLYFLHGQDTVRSGEMNKSKLILFFWSPDCENCHDFSAVLKDYYASITEKGYSVIAVSLNENRQIAECFVEKNNYPWSSFSFDSVNLDLFYQKLRIHSIPKVISVNDGTIRSVKSGKPFLDELVKAEGLHR